MANQKNSSTSNEGLSFKDKPIVRSGNVFYYGFPTDRFVTRLEITETKKTDAGETPSQIAIELLDAVDSKNPRPIMRADRTNLYDALDIAWIWMERAQSEMQD